MVCSSTSYCCQLHTNGIAFDCLEISPYTRLFISFSLSSFSRFFSLTGEEEEGASGGTLSDGSSSKGFIVPSATLTPPVIPDTPSVASDMSTVILETTIMDEAHLQKLYLFLIFQVKNKIEPTLKYKGYLIRLAWRLAIMADEPPVNKSLQASTFAGHSHIFLYILHLMSNKLLMMYFLEYVKNFSIDLWFLIVDMELRFSLEELLGYKCSKQRSTIYSYVFSMELVSQLQETQGRPRQFLGNLIPKRGSMLQPKTDVDTLLAMGIMEDVSIVPQPAGDSGKVDLTINAVERISGGISAGGGISSGCFTYEFFHMQNRKWPFSRTYGKWDTRL
ncbi:unnamed protein product [Lactuca saligna]|uniref:Uncharacterized protein n=1 Tax=Lactuca saligna TaxID=75948 RepID=A0AA35UWN2_LACSI|nr:unnamed protein product [Lactuca saligna]